MFYCPCCGYETLEERGGFDICHICFWEDDPVQADDLDYETGCNDVSLRQARANYAAMGAVAYRLKQYVRQASDEPRDPAAPYPTD